MIPKRGSTRRTDWPTTGLGPNHFTLKMEAAWSSETMISYHITAMVAQPKVPRLEMRLQVTFQSRLYKYLAQITSLVRPY